MTDIGAHANMLLLPGGVVQFPSDEHYDEHGDLSYLTYIEDYWYFDDPDIVYYSEVDEFPGYGRMIVPLKEGRTISHRYFYSEPGGSVGRIKQTFDGVVEVVDKPTSVVWGLLANIFDATVEQGQFVHLHAAALSSYIDYYSTTFRGRRNMAKITSSDPEIVDVAVNSAQKSYHLMTPLYARAPGQATITIEAEGLSLSIPVTVKGDASIVDLDSDMPEYRIMDNSIVVTNLEDNEIVSLYSVDGHCVFSDIAVNGELTTPELSGFYILKVGDRLTTKVLLKNNI